jgi:hypothetical protein
MGPAEVILRGCSSLQSLEVILDDSGLEASEVRQAGQQLVKTTGCDTGSF